MFLSNIKENDTFVYEVKDCIYKEYNGCYLIFNMVRNFRGVETEKILSRIKITKTLPVVFNKNVLDDMEWIQIGSIWYEERFYPLENGKIPEERKKASYHPNENGMLEEYLFEIISNKLPSSFVYIGNYELEKPKEEFIPWTIHNVDSAIPSNIDDYILKCYIASKNLKIDPEYSKKRNLLAKEIIDGAALHIQNIEDTNVK